MHKNLIGLTLILIFATHASAQDIAGFLRNAMGEPQNNSVANDEVEISSNSKDELIGPDGLRISCIGLAMFEYGNGWAKTSGGGALYDGLGNRKQTFKPDEGHFNVKFINWTPEIVDYLKGAVDTCVANKNDGLLKRILLGGDNSAVRMSPSRAKKLFDDIYAVALVTNRNNEQQAENRRQWELANKNKELALQQHIQKLKNGEIKIQSVNDANHYFSAQPLIPIIISPLLSPDNQYYYGEIIIDYQEKQNLLRAKIEDQIDMRGIPKLLSVAYVFLQTDNKSVSFNPELLRIGQRIQVVGKYVKNIQYTTISGEVKIAPAMQVLYMGGA